MSHSTTLTQTFGSSSPTDKMSLDHLCTVLDDPQVRALSSIYETYCLQKHVNLGFNAFALVSDVFYRENFHSDIMAAILNPGGEHHQGDRYLRLFLEFLRDQHQVSLRTEDYKNAVIERESGKIDILIYDKTSSKAIIIENKINGAADMDRQVLRYLQKVKDWNFTCDAIVYLSLNSKKNPDTYGWSDEEKESVRPLLRSITAYDESEKCLYRSWLLSCIDKTDNAEVSHVIRQYSDLILKLGKNSMHHSSIEDYYTHLQDGDRYEVALSIARMTRELPSYRCQKLISEFQCIQHGFSRLWKYNPTVAIFEGISIDNGRGMKISVDTSHEHKTLIQFFDNNDPQKGILPRRILHDLDMVDQFNENQGKFEIHFEFPKQENLLRIFLTDFIKNLSQLTRNLS